MSLSALALALGLLAAAAAPARGARGLAAAAEPQILELSCARAAVPKGVFQLKARATYDCGRTVEGVDRPGAPPPPRPRPRPGRRPFLLGGEASSHAPTPTHLPLGRRPGCLSVLRRVRLPVPQARAGRPRGGHLQLPPRLWRLNFDEVTRSGSVSTFDRDCPSGKQSFLTVTSAGELVLSSRPAKWRKQGKRLI